MLMHWPLQKFLKETVMNKVNILTGTNVFGNVIRQDVLEIRRVYEAKMNCCENVEERKLLFHASPLPRFDEPGYGDWHESLNVATSNVVNRVCRLWEDRFNELIVEGKLSA